MLFSRPEAKDAGKVLRLRGDQWRQGEVLRVTSRRRWDADPEAKSLVVTRKDYGELALSPMRRGLIPAWERGEGHDRPLVSVRAETVAEHVEWRRLLNTKRCLIPTDQFFEWKRVGDVKTKEYAFKLRTHRPMMIAGLWSQSATQRTDCFAYISCPSNRMVSLVHDRMPVVLDEAGLSLWLNPDASLEALLRLLQPLPDGALELHPVGQPEVRVKPYQPSLFAPRAA